MNLRRIIAVAAIFVVATFCLRGQSKELDPSLKFEVRVGASVPKWSLFTNSRLIDGWGWCGDASWEKWTIAGLIDNYAGPIYSTGALTAEFSYILKRWLTFSMGIGYNHYWKSLYSGIDDSYLGRANAAAITFMPLARFTYYARRNVKLYSGAGLGVAWYHNYSATKYPWCEFGDIRNEDLVNPMLQTIPIGITVGNKFFGFSELGFGSVWCGIRAGVGYRF